MTAPKESPRLERVLRECERRTIEAELRKRRGHVTETAEALGISRRMLDRKLDEHDLRSVAAELRSKAGIPGPRQGADE